MPAATYMPGWLLTRIVSRDARLRTLGFADYNAYLDSPAWAAKKAVYRASDRPQDCGLCGADENLQLHHMTYERVGDEALEDLIPLCPTCHSLIHTLERRQEIGLDMTGLENKERAMQNRVKEAEREQRQQDERSQMRRDEENKRRSRALRSRLQEALSLAFRRNADVEPGIAVIEQGIELLKAQPGDPP